MMLRSCKVAIVAVIGPLTMLHLFKSVPFFFALELKPSAKLIKRKPDSWVSVLTKMKMQECRGACGLNPFSTRVCGLRSLVLDRTRAHAYCSMSVRHHWQDPVLNSFIALCLVFNPFCITLMWAFLFATLLLPLVLNLDRSSVPSIRIKASIAHRSCSFEG